ncbi:aerolysin-like protein [Selaginella moellendorffii]|nr:aerolysin-like protein [Selaginella moellendorffii]|eukprot:XP_024533565.1 aerolysin-like protein [Selaginella moellendorffii]
MSLWLGEWDYVGDRAGAIMFTTSLGNTFQHGYQGGSATVINVYAGILVGADIHAGDDVNAWGFAFLLPLVSCQLQGVRYYNISALGSIVPETLDTLKCSNNSEVPVQWKLDGSKDMTISYSWSQAEGLTTSQTVTVNASILDIFKTESSYQWQESEQSTNTVEYSGTKNLEWSEGNTLAPGASVNIQAVTYAGKINVPYSGVMVVKLDTGESFSFPQTGTYTGVSVTETDVTSG